MFLSIGVIHLLNMKCIPFSERVVFVLILEQLYVVWVKKSVTRIKVSEKKEYIQCFIGHITYLYIHTWNVFSAFHPSLGAVVLL